MKCILKTMIPGLTDSSPVNAKFSNCYFTDECLFSFDRTGLNSCTFNLCSDQEGQSLTKIIRASRRHSAMPKSIDIVNFEEVKMLNAIKETYNL